MNEAIRNVLSQNKELKGQWQEFVMELKSMDLPLSDPYAAYFSAARESILLADDLGTMLQRDPTLKSISLRDLHDNHDAYFASVLPSKADGTDGYDFFYANPDYACKVFGLEMGQILSAAFLSFRACHNHIIMQSYLRLQNATILFRAFYDLWKARNTLPADWKSAYADLMTSDLERTSLLNAYYNYSPDYTRCADIVMNADYSDIRYLYSFGNYLAPRDIQMAQFISQYPEDELISLAQYIVQSYLDGFERGGKDHRIKTYASLMFPLGMERFARLVALELKRVGLEPKIGNPMSIGPNRQYSYDVRFTQALYLSEANADLLIDSQIVSVEAMKDAIRANAGPIYIEVFGEEPFEPADKDTALKLNDAQRALQRRTQGKFSQYYNENFPSSERSFCIIAFPSPEIGPKFEEIFAETVRLNRLDSNRYATIQQHIIEVLDTAQYVHVIGVAGNDTDIRVAMHTLNDPQNETNFENCVADVNIPVGEVFTSPMLTGTNGILHVDDIYLGNLRFLNLKIEFTDGMVSGYSCTNFPEAEKNRLYIEENLLHPHKTLPIGEFAIGTNTLAYAMAKKYDIMHLLPILIIEKMGPHFAIGDTCYSHEEEFPHHNIASKKLIIAVDNEMSAKRHEDPMQAYTQKHMDITLPYEMLDEISAVTPDGTRIPIIKNGRFAVPGTEELNLPLI